MPLGAPAGDGEILAGKPMTYWQDAWRRFCKNKVALCAAALLLLIVLFTLLGPVLCPYDFSAQNVKIRNQRPSAAHWFGTDSLGRDLFARVAVGGRVSIVIGICGALIVGVIGCLYGGLAAYFVGMLLLSSTTESRITSSRLGTLLRISTIRIMIISTVPPR